MIYTQWYKNFIHCGLDARIPNYLVERLITQHLLIPKFELIDTQIFVQISGSNFQVVLTLGQDSHTSFYIRMHKQRESGMIEIAVLRIINMIENNWTKSINFRPTNACYFFHLLVFPWCLYVYTFYLVLIDL